MGRFGDKRWYLVPTIRPARLSDQTTLGFSRVLWILVLASALFLRMWTFQARAIGVDPAEYCWISWFGFLPHSPYLLYALAGFGLSQIVHPEWGLSLLSLGANLIATLLFAGVLARQGFSSIAQKTAVAVYLLGPLAILQAGLQEVYTFQSCLIMASLYLMAGPRPGLRDVVRATGASSVPGAAGASGASSVPGAAGASGAADVTDASGASSVPGASGASSVPGAAGASGASSVPGASGLSGAVFGAAWLAHNGSIFALPALVAMLHQHLGSRASQDGPPRNSQGGTTRIPLSEHWKAPRLDQLGDSQGNPPGDAPCDPPPRLFGLERSGLTRLATWFAAMLTVLALGYGALWWRLQQLFGDRALEMTRAALRGISPLPGETPRHTSLDTSMLRLLEHLSRPIALGWPFWTLLFLCVAAFLWTCDRGRLARWALLPAPYILYEIWMGGSPDVGAYAVYVLPFAAVAVGETQEGLGRMVAGWLGSGETAAPRTLEARAGKAGWMAVSSNGHPNGPGAAEGSMSASSNGHPNGPGAAEGSMSASSEGHPVGLGAGEGPMAAIVGPRETGAFGRASRSRMLGIKQQTVAWGLWFPLATLLFVPALTLGLVSDPPTWWHTPAEPDRALLRWVSRHSPRDTLLAGGGTGLNPLLLGCWSGRMVLQANPFGIPCDGCDNQVSYKVPAVPRWGSGFCGPFLETLSPEALVRRLEAGQWILAFSRVPFSGPAGERLREGLGRQYVLRPCRLDGWRPSTGLSLYRLMLPGAPLEVRCGIE